MDLASLQDVDELEPADNSGLCLRMNLNVARLQEKESIESVSAMSVLVKRVGVDSQSSELSDLPSSWTVTRGKE